MENVINVGHSKFWTDNDILYCQLSNINSNYKLDADKVELFINAIVKLCKGKAMPFIIDARDSRGAFTTSGASLFAKSPKLVKLRISEAFILNSIGIKLLIATYKRIYDPITPHGVFKELTSAKMYCIENKNKYYGSN